MEKIKDILIYLVLFPFLFFTFLMVFGIPPNVTLKLIVILFPVIATFYYGVITDKVDLDGSKLDKKFGRWLTASFFLLIPWLWFLFYS